ncbi:hypothetical protein GUJ93_ZPchr0008g13425 [Zizania palustris]|uniref:Uncharacterized protein n=1 Tax=Zizania palustris TaxID=103762 RepID=A0A8J5QZE0_ZIZPA|nr:hypothetical protein GUJ93_ZPchr0008g13425 [Zizania palustris]
MSPLRTSVSFGQPLLALYGTLSTREEHRSVSPSGGRLSGRRREERLGRPPLLPVLQAVAARSVSGDRHRSSAARAAALRRASGRRRASASGRSAPPRLGPPRLGPTPRQRLWLQCSAAPRAPAPRADAAHQRLWPPCSARAVRRRSVRSRAAVRRLAQRPGGEEGKFLLGLGFG